MNVTSDIAAMLADFGLSVTIGGVTVQALFDDSYTDAMQFSGSFPALTCASADVSTVAQGAAVVVNSISYTVAAIKPDGSGVTLLQLVEA
jgi:hypothetical protein